MGKKEYIYRIQIYFPEKGINLTVWSDGLNNKKRDFVVSLYAELANNYLYPDRIILEKFPEGDKEKREKVKLSEVEKKLLNSETKYKLNIN